MHRLLVIVELVFAGTLMIVAATDPAQSWQLVLTPTAVVETPALKQEVPETVPEPLVIIRREHATDVEPIAVGAVTSNDDWTPHEQTLNGTAMVLVPPGEFLMGSTAEEIDAAHALLAEGLGDVNVEALTFFDGELVSEANRHRITRAYWIDKFEVTNAQFRQCILAGACAPAAEYPPDDTYPMRFVSLSKARDYCVWRGGRVPTEVEWEYAARGPDRLIFPWGNAFSPTIANYSDQPTSGANNQSVDGFERVVPVDQYADGVSWVGAYNMAGNVTEWTRSLWAPYPYDNNDGRENQPDRPDNSYVVRGGSFMSGPATLRTTWRGTKRDILGDPAVGFRCVYPYDVPDLQISESLQPLNPVIRSFTVDDPDAVSGRESIASWDVEGVETVSLEIWGFVSYQQPQIRRIAAYDNLPASGMQVFTIPDVPAALYLIVDPHILPDHRPNATIQLVPD